MPDLPNCGHHVTLLSCTHGFCVCGANSSAECNDLALCHGSHIATEAQAGGWATKRSSVWKRSTSLPQLVQPAVRLRANSCAPRASGP
jgi:hypothetical protein